MTMRHYPSGIVGLPFPNHDGALCRDVIARHLAAGDVVQLERDVDNASDADAIAVFLAEVGERHHLGWVPKRHTAWIGEQLDAGRRLEARVSDIHTRAGAVVNVDLEIALERRAGS